MTDRALLFVISLAAVIGALAVAVWLIFSRQLGTFDGNFVFLSALIVAAAFALYLKFLIGNAMKAAERPKPVAPAEKKPAATPELVGKA